MLKISSVPMNGKVTLITGAGSGIGRHFALRFASEGAHVAAADLNAEAVDETVRAITAAGGKAIAIQMDVTSESSVEEGMGKIRSQLGSVEVLIANAGIQHISPFADFPLADWKRVMEVNVDGVFLTARAVFQDRVRQKKPGSILIMGSIHSHIASDLKAAYITAKHGVAGLARSIAREGGPHDIRCYLICPGFVDTPLVRQQIPLQAERLGKTEEEIVRNVMLGNTVDGKFTTVEELAQVALFLANFPTGALTGQAFVVSHGADMH
jgi:3-hydroxybutyrate dehydrogenase